MDRRYQVFVSSTYEDLQEERKEVIQALLEMDCIPAGMELFQASNDDQWTLIKNVIDGSDYYIVIVGGKYGSINKDGKSYTQMEYEYALSKNKPIIGFLPKNLNEIPFGKTEQDPEKKEKLARFIDMVKNKTIKYWSNAVELGSAVSRSMNNLMRTNPAKGWVRADSIVDEESVKEISRLQKENAELKSKLAKTAEAPEGSEFLSQGDDKVDVYLNVNIAKENGKIQKNQFKCTLTWNEVFKWVALSLYEELRETYIRNIINERLLEYVNDITDNVELNILKEYGISGVQIGEQSFQMFLIQWKALGLIDLTIEYGERLWKITSYGDKQITYSLAVKR